MEKKKPANIFVYLFRHILVEKFDECDKLFFEQAICYCHCVIKYCDLFNFCCAQCHNFLVCTKDDSYICIYTFSAVYCPNMHSYQLQFELLPQTSYKVFRRIFFFIHLITKTASVHDLFVLIAHYHSCSYSLVYFCRVIFAVDLGVVLKDVLFDIYWGLFYLIS